MRYESAAAFRMALEQRLKAEAERTAEQLSNVVEEAVKDRQAATLSSLGHGPLGFA